jgi:hypothetical protein
MARKHPKFGIEWIEAQIKRAANGIGEMRFLDKSAINDRDVTAERKSSYLRQIQHYTNMLTNLKRRGK